MNHIATIIMDGACNYIGICMVTFITIWVSNCIYRWRNPKCNGVLPPGSMGLPIIGETIQLLSPNSTFDVSPFIKERVKRYGPIFKTSLIGRQAAVITDPELIYYVLKQEGKLFESSYPKAFIKLFGDTSSARESMLKYLKSLILKFYNPEYLRSVALHDTEKSCCTTFKSWSNQQCFELREAISDMVFDVTAKGLISYKTSNAEENLRLCFSTFLENLISLPIDIPGMAHHKCLQGRRRAMNVLKRILTERMSTKNRQCQDFFDLVVAELKEENSPMTETIALDLIFALLFASSETISTGLSIAMKFLSENPRALLELTEEHEAIVRNRKDPDSSVTWEEYKSMTFTSHVIYESLRLASIVPVIFRKSLQDVEIGGYTIPKGWEVILSSHSVHVNSEIYEDPFIFNPWRWKVKPEVTVKKQFMAFGAGLRFCVGANFSYVFMSLFFHHLVTKYRWRTIRGGNILRAPTLRFPGGFYIQVSPKE